MKLEKFVGTLVREPDYLRGISERGFEWSKITFYLRENGVESEDVYPFSIFGGKAKDYNDMGLVEGDMLDVVYKVSSREGSGVYEGKYFLSLDIESLDYIGKNTGLSGVGSEVVEGLHSDGSVDDSFMNEDPFGGSFDDNVSEESDDLPF